ncbi:carbamate kinase [Escherichia coli]|nr:carbamate kinase [Escherichia coli]EFO5646689.1 carbamate kinase [Escherichia coli]
MIHAFIKKGCFQDSVSLMIISRKLSESENVDDVSVMMGTPANKALLDTTGFWHDDFNNATPNDICVAIRSEAADAGIAQAIMQQLEEALKQLAQGSGSSQALTQVRRWDSACQKLPDANLALISVAGEYAAELTNQALDRNLNVMMFSDNVTLEDEIQLKTRAREKGLLVMGPDCGTSMIAGTPLAFANVMPEGNIGVIGASGTGIQELCSQIALAGEGITHAIGLGGRDLSREVGGISALTALEMLSADEKSEVLAFVSKPPAEAVRLKIVNAMKATGKPTVALFLGYTPAVARDENVWFASSLDEAARLARSYRLAIVHGNGPQVGLLALQNLAWKEVEPYPLDVLVAESQGMIGYMLAQSLSAQPQMPPVTTVLTRIEVSPDDPAFLQPEKFIGPVYQPEEQEALEAAYGWQMKRDGKYLRRVVASPQPRKILDSEAIELLLKEGHVVICSGGGGVPVTEDGAGSEAVIDKDLAAALLAEQINADGLVILTDADAVYENWGTPQQRAIRHATPDELAPFAKADGSMGPKVTAVSGYVRSRGKPAWIGALSRIEETLAGEAGTCISL